MDSRTMNHFKMAKVLICGGTHGNELTGVYMVKHLEELLSNTKLTSLKIDVMMANEQAVNLVQRYVDQDLNRCFTKSILEDLNNSSVTEHIRAREIFALHHDKDLIIDIHNTTSDMGITLISVDISNEFIARLIHYIQEMFPKERVYPLYFCSESSGPLEVSCMSSICLNGIGIELGPQSHGTLKWNLFQTCKDVIFAMLSFCEQVSRNGLPREAISLRCFVGWEKVDFPRNDKGEIVAAIHPNVKDYTKVSKGSPIFIKFTEEVITYKGEESFYAVFVAEASYLEKGIAFWKTRERILNIGENL